MNEANYRWLRGYLQQLPPEQFDYKNCWLGRECGCVAFHLVTAGVAKRECELADTAGPPVIAKFLDISTIEAVALYRGEASDGECWMSNYRFGVAGIRRAIQCLDEIAASYGLTPDIQDPAQPEPQPEFTGDADAFLAKLREQISQPASQVLIERERA